MNPMFISQMAQKCNYYWWRVTSNELDTCLCDLCLRGGMENCISDIGTIKKITYTHIYVFLIRNGMNS